MAGSGMSTFDYYDGLGAYGDAAPEEPVAAVKTIASVGATVAKNLVAVGFSPDALVRLSSGQFLWSDAPQGLVASRHTIEELAKNFAVWSTLHLKWAMNGKRDDGSPYSWALWLEGGKVIADGAAYVGGVSWSDSEVANELLAIKQTASDAVSPSVWPLWAKVGIGLGVAAVGGIYVVPLLSAARRST